MDHVLHIHSSAGRPGLPAPFTVINNAAMSVRMDRCFHNPACSSFGYVSRSRNVGSYGSSMFMIFSFIGHQELNSKRCT